MSTFDTLPGRIAITQVGAVVPATDARTARFTQGSRDGLRQGSSVTGGRTDVAELQWAGAARPAESHRGPMLAGSALSPISE